MSTASIQIQDTATDEPAAERIGSSKHVVAGPFSSAARIMLWLMVASHLLFAVADLHYPGATLPDLYLIKTLEFLATVAGLWALSRTNQESTARSVMLVCMTTACVLMAAGGSICNDPTRAAFLCLALTWGSAVMLPWGSTVQLTLGVTATAALLFTPWLIQGKVFDVLKPAPFATALALVGSSGLAHHLDRQRRRATRETLRRADATRKNLQRSVVERTEQLRAVDHRLRESEQRFRIVSELTSDYAYAFIVGEDRKLTLEWFTESAFLRITGFTVDEVRERGGALRLAHRDDEPIARAHLRTLVAGHSDTSEFRIVTKGGESRWIRNYGWAELQGGRVIRIYGAAQDITPRKLAETALRASEVRFRVLAEQSSDAILLTSAEGVISYASPAVARIMGYSPAEMVGQDAFEFVHPEDLAIAECRFADVLAGKTVAPLTAQFRVRRKDGSWCWVDAVGSNLLSTPGVNAVFTTMRDVTRSKEAEESPQREQRFAAAPTAPVQ